MNRYRCPGFRTVRAESARDAAEVFAGREARRQYGARGYCRTCCPGAHTPDGRTQEFNCFIGYATGMHETTGHNVTLTVYWEGGVA